MIIHFTRSPSTSKEIFFVTIPYEVGDPIEDIVSLILEATNIRSFTKNNRSILKLIQKSMIAYKNKEILSGFAEKFEQEINRRLSYSRKEAKFGCISDYEELYLVKAFIDIYRNELNNIKEDKDDN